MRFLPVVTALLSLIHLSLLAASGPQTEPILLIAALYPGIRIFRIWKSRRIQRLSSWGTVSAMLREWTAVLILLSLLLDFFLNVASFEPNPKARKSFLNLLTLGSLLIPISTAFLSASARRRLNYHAVLIVLLPPAALTLIPRIGYPSYGLALLLIGLLSLQPRRMLAASSIAEAWLLVPFALVPLFWTLFPEAPVQQAIELLIVFLATLLLVPHFQRKGALEKAVGFITIFYLPFFVLLAVYPGFHAINSNISSVLLETLVFFSLLAFLYFKRGRWAYVLFAISCYLLIYRIDSRSSLAATAIGLMAIAAVLLIKRLTVQQTRLRKLLAGGFSLGLFSTVIILMLVLQSWRDVQSIFIRNILWDSVIAGLLESPAHLLAGTGNFGYFFYLPRHWSVPVGEAQRLVLQLEAHSINHNPHNDFLLMLYGGGLLYLATFVVFFARTVWQALTANIARHTVLLLAVLTTLTIHSITEPLLSTISTSFLFWFVATLLRNKQRLQKMPRSLLAALLLFSVFLLSGEVLRAPVQKFWNTHPGIFPAIRSDQPQLPPVPDDATVDAMVQNIERSRLFFPLDSDLIRQQGDLRLFQALRSSTERDTYARQAASFYCEAFRRRPVAIHYAGIRRAMRNMSSPYRCNFDARYEALFRRYDPIRHIENHAF